MGDFPDDEVDYEIDVYLSKNLSENLTLFQYPTRLASRNYDYVQYNSARIKPNQQKVEVEVNIDTYSNNYDKSKGEQIALNTDGYTSTEPYFESSKMDKQILVSSKNLHSKNQYAIGILREDGLHITPLHSILTLKPSFSYLDRADAQSKKNQTNDEEEEGEIVAITPRFEGADSERAKKTREKSYQYLQQKSASEPWINLAIHQNGSKRSNVLKEMLYCSKKNMNITNCNEMQQNCIRQLALGCLSYCSTDLSNDGEYEIDIKNKSFSDQIKCYMMNAQVLRFSRIVNLLERNKSIIDSLKDPVETSSIDISAVERVVQQLGVLVQGCWVIKSDLLYPEGSLSKFTGISSETLRLARDYMLWHFTKSKYISKREISSVIHIPNEDLDDMLKPITKPCEHGWEFKIPFDDEFVENHRAVEKSQEIKWDLRYKKLIKELHLSQDGGIKKSVIPAPPRQRQKRQQLSSLSEDGDESGIEGGPSPKEIKQQTKQHKITNKKRPNISPSKNRLKSKQYHIATLDVKPTFFETALSDDIKVELIRIVEEAIRSQFCMTLSEVKSLVSESHLGSIANRTDFQKLLEEALIKCGARCLNNKWPQNTSPESLYAFAKFGNKIDRYRNALLDLFTNMARSRINFLVKKVEDELGEIISETECKHIFEDYCIYKSGFYYLKGTISPDS